MKFLKNEKKKMETRNTWDKQKTNRRMTDSIISIIILKGNSINIPLKKKNQSLQRLSKIANVGTSLVVQWLTLSSQGRVAGLNP